MADALIPVGIEFGLKNIDKTNEEINRVLKQFGVTTISTMGGVTTAAASESRKRVTISQQEVAQKTQHIRSYDELSKEYAGKNTKYLTDAIGKNIIAINDEKRQKVESLQAGDRVAAKIHTDTLQRIQVEQNALRSLAAQRTDVQTRGAGAGVGILGVGRFITGSLISQIPGVPNFLGGGGSAMLGGGAASSLSALGPAGAAAGAGLTAFGAAAGFSIKQGMGMEDALAKLSAQSGITGNDLDSLRTKAEANAVKFRTDGTDAVDSYRLTINALGLDLTKNIPLLDSMTNSIMTLAKASGLDAAQAADSASTAFNMFGHSIHDANAAEEFQKITNVLAAGARQARTQIPDLVQELSFVGPEAHKAGLSIEETVSAMEALGHAGIKPEQVGAELRAFMMQLEAGSKKAQDALGKLGLTFYDINPTTVGFSKSIHTLKEKLDEIYDPTTKVGDATKRAHIEQDIFQRRTSSLAEAMFANVDTFDNYTKAVTGTHDAEDMASKMTHTLSQDMAGLWEQFKNEGSNAFYKFRPELEKIPGAIDKEIPKLFELIGVLEKTGAAFYHVWELAGSLDAKLQQGDTWLDHIFHTEDADEKNEDAQARIDAFNKTHALTQDQIDKYTKQNALIDSLGPDPNKTLYGTSPFDANGNPIVTSAVAQSGPALNGKKGKSEASIEHGKYEKAEDALKAHHAVLWDEAQRSITSDTALKENKFLSDKALLVSQYMLEVQYKQKTSDTLDAIAKLNEAHHQQQLKDAADASKKEADAEGKAWDAQLKQMAEHNKAVEELARKRVDRQREIDTKLQDQSDSTIQDKTKRETQQEQTRYEREQQKILDQADGTKGTHDQINQELELLEQDHWARIAQITDDGAGKSAKSVDKLSDSIKGLKGASSDLAKNWGEVVGPILAFAFDQIEKSQAQDQIHTTTKRQQPIPGIPGTGDWTQSQSIFNTSFPGDSSFFTGFHDTPGTLADSSGAGTIPVGNGKYMVIGQHNDRLVKDNPSPITFSSYKPDLSLPTKVQGGSTTSVATHPEKHVDPIALQEAALKVHTDNVRDAQTARYLGTSVAAIRESRKLGDEKMVEAMKEIGIKLPIEVISGAAIGEGIAAGTEAFEGTQLGESILGHPLGRILSNGLEHAGGHISGNLLGSYVAEGSIPGFHDSPPLSQTGAPQIGGKYLVAGDGDDSLVKANYITQLPSMLTMAVTRGMNASDVAQHTQTIANVASGASSVYSSRRTDPSSKSSDDLSDVMQFSSSLGNMFSAFSSAGKNQAGSGAKVMSSLGGLLGDKESQKLLTSLNGGKAPIAFGDTGFGAQGAAGQIGGMASTLGGIGSIIGMGTQPSPGVTHIADPYSAEARAWIAQARKLRAPSVANILGNITSHAAPFASIIAPVPGALLSTAGNILGSYETGTPNVPKTGYYQLHEGERVVSAKENIQPVYRSSSSGGGQSGPMRLHPDDIRSLSDAMSQRGIPVETFRTAYAQANNKVHTWD